MKHTSVAIPFGRIGNRQFLTAQHIAEFPWLKKFIDRYKHCFEYDQTRDVWWYDPDDKDVHE